MNGKTASDHVLSRNCGERALNSSMPRTTGAGPTERVVGSNGGLLEVEIPGGELLNLCGLKGCNALYRSHPGAASGERRTKRIRPAWRWAPMPILAYMLIMYVVGTERGYALAAETLAKSRVEVSAIQRETSPFWGQGAWAGEFDSTGSAGGVNLGRAGRTARD
jgi:hypothetical protein